MDPGFAGFYSESNVRVEKASRSLRRFLGFPFVACTKDLLASLVFPSSFFFFSLLDFLEDFWSESGGYWQRKLRYFGVGGIFAGFGCIWGMSNFG